ncbi:MAG: TetR/AcrR family transcriptional regulator [Pseudomonadota bacterium]|jgi:TetR/AcrR family transcriptional repressor of nem operon
MRYDKDRKARSRRLIVEAAAKRIRKNGISTTSVVTFMADAKLTHGGFYSHFRSKDALVQEALIESFQEMRARLAEAASHGGVDMIVRSYLQPVHRDRTEQGCPVVALAGEIHRQSGRIRSAFRRELDQHLQLIQDHLPAEMDAGQRKKMATSVFSIMVGTLQLARAVNDTTMSDAILENGAAAALSVIAAQSHPAGKAPFN